MRKINNNLKDLDFFKDLVGKK